MTSMDSSQPSSTKASDVNPLGTLMRAILGGGIEIVDLTVTLQPDFPTIVLPPEFGQAWPFRIEEISRYDHRGPAWYHNTGDRWGHLHSVKCPGLLGIG